jgi:hypothetical protein
MRMTGVISARPMKKLLRFPAVIALSILAGVAASPAADPQWVVYEGKDGPGKGKHIVFLSGDEEYRSEEALPQLARILADRHGFKCTVLFPIDPKTGEIDPNTKDNIPGLEALGSADMAVMLLRFRELPDDQMKHFVDFLNSGKPILALRTSTHAFNYSKDSKSPYAKFHWQSKEPWLGGFGKQVLGETWVAHHGAHKKEATKGIIEETAKDHPIVRGVEEIFGDTDVYTANPPDDAKVLVRGQVLAGMKPTDLPVEGKKNEPMQPVYWLRDWKGEAGKTSKIITTTMGSSTDLQSEGFRRLLVNSVYWALGLEVPAKADVALVGDYKPTFYGFNSFQKGRKPADYSASQK